MFKSITVILTENIFLEFGTIKSSTTMVDKLLKLLGIFMGEEVVLRISEVPAFI